MGVRKNYRNLTADERDRFVDAVKHVKSTGVVDHFATCTSTTSTWAFTGARTSSPGTGSSCSASRRS